MLSIDLGSLWSDDIDKIVIGVKEATENIKYYIDKLHNGENTRHMFNEIYKDILEVCSFWSGKTSVGNRKQKNIENAFQNFFEALMNMLLYIKNNNDSALKKEILFANSVLYRGKIYRYLGNNGPNGNVIEPEYNNIYVSWSKEHENAYLESKLYGVKTRLYCDIKEPYFGIDLEGIGASRSNEKEVVFPTFKECITNIEYIPEDCDDET